MTQIEQYQESAAPSKFVSLSFGDIGQLAEKLSNSNFVPARYRGKPDETFSCILAGQEVGVSPLQALQNIYELNGNLRMMEKLAMGLVRAAGHEVETIEWNSSVCKMRARRRGQTNWMQVEYTIQDAQAANLINKPNWKLNKKAMLHHRCSDMIANALFQDALMGFRLGHGSDIDPDFEDEIDSNFVEEKPKTNKRRSALAPKEEPKPSAITVVDVEQIEDEQQSEPLRHPLQDAKRTQRLYILAGEAKISRDEVHEYIGENFGIDSTKELQDAEYSQVVDYLESQKKASQPESNEDTSQWDDLAWKNHISGNGKRLAQVIQWCQSNNIEVSNIQGIIDSPEQAKIKEFIETP